MSRLCAWCDAPATTSVTVEPEVFKSVGGVKKLIHAARTVPACPAHSTYQGTPPPTVAATQAGPGSDDRLRLPRPSVTSPADFLRALWGDTPPGLIQIWELDGKRSSYYQAPYGASVLAGRTDVYTGVGLAHKDHGRSRRARADQVIAIPGLWLDIDINGGPDNKTGAAPNLETAIAIAVAYAEPTLTVNSGYGLHAWHLFDEPWRFATRDEQQRAALASAQWFALHRAAAAEYQAGIDAAHDLARLMRVPGTHNGKGGQAVPVMANPITGPRFEREQLLHLADQAGNVPISGPAAITGDQLQIDVQSGNVADTTRVKAAALIDNIPEFAAAWQHRLGARAAMWTLSEYDLSLCGQAAQAGFTDQELADLIALHRAAHHDQSGKAQRLDYLRRTIGLVRARSDRDQAADTLEQLRRAA